MRLTETAEAFIRDHEGEAFNLLETLAKIPSPSNHEERRAVFIKNWLEEQGAKGVYLDGAMNVIYPLGDLSGKLDVFTAHTDVVFTDTEELPVHIEGGRIFAPGIGDDTANLAAMLLAAKFIIKRKLTPAPGRGIIIAANTGEEGLGNLRGSREICRIFGNRMDEFISFDGTFRKITSKAVGSMRYKITVRTRGGHSYSDFGRPNAIAILASIINTLYEIEVPSPGTTYNVGTISGGISVNTIAQEAEVLYEFRSDSRESLLFMEKHLEAVLALYRARCITLESVLVGERPCGSNVDAEKQERLLKRGLEAIKTHAGIDAPLEAGSTDCNIPLSMRVPSMTLGCYIGEGAHTYQEWLDIESLKAGYRIAFELVLDKVG